MQKSKPAKTKTVKTTIPKWKGRTAETHSKHLEALKSNEMKYDVCLLGDSLTEHWLDDGADVWKSSPLATKYKIFNAGVGGDMTQNVLWRLEEKLLSAPPLLSVRLILLLIGANNVRDDPEAHIIAGIESICAKIHTDLPKAQIIVCSILPILEEKQNQKVKAINLQLESLAKEKQSNWKFHNFTILFEEIPGGNPNREYFRDHIHLNANGYGKWAAPLFQLIEPSLTKEQ